MLTGLGWGCSPGLSHDRPCVPQPVLLTVALVRVPVNTSFLHTDFYVGSVGCGLYQLNVLDKRQICLNVRKADAATRLLPQAGHSSHVGVSGACPPASDHRQAAHRRCCGDGCGHCSRAPWGSVLWAGGLPLASQLGFQMAPGASHMHVGATWPAPGRRWAHLQPSLLGRALEET